MISGFILAAGAGTRMRPATLHRPKAMLPFCGIPLLDLALDEMTAALPDGAPVVVNACYLGEQVQAEVARLAPASAHPLFCSVETALLNHGGGIRQGVMSFVPETDHIAVCNVDVVTDYPMADLVKEHLASGADATMLLIDNHRPDGVAINEDGTILSFHSGRPGYTFAGIYILKRRLLEFLTPGEPAPSIITAFARAARNGCRIQGVIAPASSWWADVGDASAYIAAHREVMGRCLDGHPALQAAVAEQRRRREALVAAGVHCTGALGLGEDIDIAPGSILHNVVIWDNVRLKTPMLYSTGVICRTPAQTPPASAAERTPAPSLLDSFALHWDGLGDSLPKQGSGRKYCRLPKTAGGAMVWSAYEPYARKENCAFAAVAELLHHIDVAAPGVVAHLPETCELLCQDLGGEELLGAPSGERRGYLLELMEMLARLHTLGAPAALELETPLQPCFDMALYSWERDYFRERFLRDVLGRPELWAEAQEEWPELAAALMREPQVTLHRDCQSANVKIFDGHPWLIDFQGMRLGAAAYDLASLFYDPYATLPRDLRQECLERYRQTIARMAGPRPPDERVLAFGAIQRLMQALGAYGKLWKGDGLEWYRQHIPAAAANLLDAATSAALPGFTTMAKAIADTLL